MTTLNTLNEDQLTVTDIQIFEYGDEFSANIALNDIFMVQRGTDGEYSIPLSHQAGWNDDADDLALTLKLDEKIKAAQLLGN